jgi:hypothetical protein
LEPPVCRANSYALTPVGTSSCLALS